MKNLIENFRFVASRLPSAPTCQLKFLCALKLIFCWFPKRECFECFKGTLTRMFVIVLRRASPATSRSLFSLIVECEAAQQPGKLARLVFVLVNLFNFDKYFHLSFKNCINPQFSSFFFFLVKSSFCLSKIMQRFLFFVKKFVRLLNVYKNFYSLNIFFYLFHRFVSLWKFFL